MTSPEASPIWPVPKGTALPQGACTLKSDTVVRVRLEGLNILCVLSVIDPTSMSPVSSSLKWDKNATLLFNMVIANLRRNNGLGTLFVKYRVSVK